MAPTKVLSGAPASGLRAHSLSNRTGSRAGRSVVAISEVLRARTPGPSVARSNRRDDAVSPPPALERTDPGPLAARHEGDADLTAILDDSRTESVTSALAVPLPSRQLPFIDPGAHQGYAARGALSALSATTQAQAEDRAGNVFNASAVPRGPVVVATGFDRLNLAVSQLVERLPPAPLTEKFETVAEWIDRFAVDVVPHRVAKYVRSVLDAGDRFRDDGPVQIPVLAQSAARVAGTLAACFSLNQLLLVLARTHPSLTPAIDSVLPAVMGAVYLSPPAALPKVILDTDDTSAAAEQLAAFRGRMHFQEARDTNKKLAAIEAFVVEYRELHALQRDVVNRGFDRRQRAQARVCIRGWREVVRRDRLERAAAAQAAAEHEELVVLRGETQRQQEELAELSTELTRTKAQLETSAERAEARLQMLSERLATAEAALEQERAMGTRLVREAELLKARLAAAVDDAEARRVALLADVGAVLRDAAARPPMWRDARQWLEQELAVHAADDESHTSSTPVSPGARPMSGLERRPPSSDAQRRPPSGGVASEALSDTVRTGGTGEAGAHHPDAAATAVQYVRWVLDRCDPDARLPRPSAVTATPPWFDALAAVAAHTLPGTDNLQRKVAAARAVQDKLALLLRWSRGPSSRLSLPDTYDPQQSLLLDDEGRSVGVAVACNFMAQVLLPAAEPRPSADAVPALVTDGSAHSDEETDTPPTPRQVAASGLVTGLRRLLEEERCAARASATAASLGLASLHCVVAERAAPPPPRYTVDEKSDLPAFFVGPEQLPGVERLAIPHVRSALDRHYRLLRRVFVQYAGAVDGEALATHVRLSVAAAERLVRDAQLRLPADFVERQCPNPEKGFDPRHFLALVVKAGLAMYPQAGSTSKAVRVVCENHLLLFCEVGDVSSLLASLRLDPMLAPLLDAARPDLAKVFRSVATEAGRVALSGFLSVLATAGVVAEQGGPRRSVSVSTTEPPGGAHVVERVARTAVRRAFAQARVSVAEHDVTLDEFIAALCLVGQHFGGPDSLLRPAVRVKRLVFSALLPAFQEKLGLS